MGLWRYSLAALIIGATLVDVLWWVPSRRDPQPRGVREPTISAETVRCRKAQLEREIADRQAELDSLP